MGGEEEMKILSNGHYREATEVEIKEMTYISDEDKIEELKQKLSDTDYIACKIAEGAATAQEYAEELKQRQIWREEINELERSKTLC